MEGVVTTRAQEKKLLLTHDFQTEAVTCHSDVKIPLLCNIQIKYRDKHWNFAPPQPETV